jgi:peptidoglycan/xylan/chitin deacetylase (PgdA/CDA1 family)
MKPSPRLLLTIDYESWFAPSRRYDFLAPEERFKIDDNFSNQVVDGILELFGSAKASFYIVGEMIDWYPELPKKIFDAGHEVGFHCQIHRRLISETEIEKDLNASVEWRKKYNVRGYRAPMINTIEGVYPLLEKNNFTYSSSIYAPSGTFLQKGRVHEIPVSTLPLLSKPKNIRAPRNMNLSLVLRGEFPYGSSMMSGLFTKTVFKIIRNYLTHQMASTLCHRYAS